MKSMTGYGRAKEELNGRTITVELRAVNHRYLDCTVKAPRQYGFLDDAVKKAAAARIARGKVEIFVGVESEEGGDVAVTVNHALAKRYLDALHDLSETIFNRILDKLIFPVLNNISSLLDNRTPAAHYRTCTFPLLSGPDPHG